jgi:circadian clock protein KaiC
VVSGIRRLDDILKGGLLRGGSYAVIGPPGSGKTILGNQICFHHAARHDGRCVYLSLLVESHSKLMRHLASLEFFDPGLIPDRIYYDSGYSALREGGPDALLAMIRATLQNRNATLLMIDGMESIRQLVEGERPIKEFVHELQAFTAMIGCTTLLLSLKDGGRSGTENAVVDGIIELTDDLVGPRAVRELVVHKFRGGDYLRGRHEVEITGEGMVVHPRTEIQFDRPPGRATEERIRMPFGVAELDRMLSGGLPSGSTTALLGAPGTGKTMLGLSFLVEGARQGQRGVYFGFYEPPPRLREKAAQVGIELGRYIDEGLIEVIWQPPLEHMLDALAEQLLEKIRADERPRRRLFIDGIEGFRAASVYPERMPRFLSAFTNQLRMYDVTALVTEELPLFHPDIDMPNPELANVVETVILLRYVELGSQLHRLISIMKMRESRYDTSLREFRITDDGLEVAASFESAEAILTGHARRSIPDPASGEGRP